MPKTLELLSNHMHGTLDPKFFLPQVTTASQLEDLFLDDKGSNSELPLSFRGPFHLQEYLQATHEKQQGIPE